MGKDHRNFSGGILGLVVLISQHWDYVEADLIRYYRADLWAAIRGEGDPILTGWRRLRVLIHGLPPEAVTVRRGLHNGQPWPMEHELAAAQIEATLLLTDTVGGALGGEKWKPVSVRVPRPEWVTTALDTAKKKIGPSGATLRKLIARGGSAVGGGRGA